MDDEARVLRIDCDDCMMQGTAACDDCVVTFLCEHDDDGATIVDLREVRALQVLARGGLAPVLRHRPRMRA